MALPPSLRRFNRETLPVLIGAVDGKRAVRDVAAIIETDRWVSFDRFHDTTKTLRERYESAGARFEVDRIHTGGAAGSGRWIIPEAQDVTRGSAAIVTPFERPICDYADNPFHVIQWTASTPPAGVTGPLVIIDDPAELAAMKTNALAGKILLTSANPRACIAHFARAAAAAVLCQSNQPNLPDAASWMKFGWGAVPLSHANCRVVGLSLSANQGAALRADHAKHGCLAIHVNVDAPRYAGAHDLVSGIVEGADDPQDEVWALAHSQEPGAMDNASGVASCIEIARVIEALIAAGKLPRPRRSIRLLHGYECYGFFHHMEHQRRLQTPLAGVVIDTIGATPAVCGKLEWHDSIPQSAGFVDQVGEAIVRAAMKPNAGGYRYHRRPFMATSDTLAGDPKYGFPCPWITTIDTTAKNRNFYNAYHSSGDDMSVMSAAGMAVCTAAMAGYLYYLANAGSKEAVELARSETARFVKSITPNKNEGKSSGNGKGKSEPASDCVKRAHYERERLEVSLNRLPRWLWGGDRRAALDAIDQCKADADAALPKPARSSQAKQAASGNRGGRGSVVSAASLRRIPRRTAFLSPTAENTPPPIASRLAAAGLPEWTLFWADGNRSIADIAEAASIENGRAVLAEQAVGYFEALAELGYVELIEPAAMVTPSQLVADLKSLGLKAGMDVIVHSSLSSIGHVKGGAEAVVDALLKVVGKRGTVMMPSFNHRAASVFNPMTTPTANGAIPDAFWRRKEALRSRQPTHALAAIGPRAEYYVADHDKTGIWAQDSPIGRLIHEGGYVLLLGVDHNASTAYHVAENAAGAQCVDPWGSRQRIVNDAGEVASVRGMAWRSEPCPTPPSSLDGPLDRGKLQTRGQVGAAACRFVKAKDLWSAHLAQLKDRCPTCPIMPERL